MNLGLGTRKKCSFLARVFLVACGISVVGLYHIRTVCSQGCTLQESLLATAQAQASETKLPPCHAQSGNSPDSRHHERHEGFCCKIGELGSAHVEIALEAPREAFIPAFLIPEMLFSAFTHPLVLSADFAFRQTHLPPPLALSHIPTTVLRI